MTLTGMKALEISTPLRLGRKAVAVAAAAGLGGVLWTIGDAASSTHFGPLAPPAPPASSLVPAAWVLDPLHWRGLAGLPARLGSMGMHWPGFLLALLLVAGSALAVIHPGAFQRPAPYRLPRTRGLIAYVSAVLIGMALPATVLLLINLVGPMSDFDVSSAMRVAFGVVIFCAFLWTLAGRDIWHPRALVRFTHGGMAGFGIAATFMVTALLLTPLEPVARAGLVPAAIRDLGLGSPGATWGAVLQWRMIIVGLAFATAGAVAVTAGPQSVGSKPRLGAGAVALGALVLLLVAGSVLSSRAHALIRDLVPNVVEELTLTPGTARPVALLPGGGHVAVPLRASGHDTETLRLYSECRDDRTDLPAPSGENIQRLQSALAATGGAVSVRASRILACLSVLHALRFEPAEAMAVLLEDPSPGRLPLATLGAAVRGAVDRASTPEGHRWLSLLTDSTRFAAPEGIRTPLRRRLETPAESAATVSGVLATEAPALWRIAVVRGQPPGEGDSPLIYAPITGAQVLQYMTAAATPDAEGRFTIAGVGAGTWQVALLGPDGFSTTTLAALSVRGDPGQFSVLAAGRRDLGTIRLSR